MNLAVRPVASFAADDFDAIGFDADDTLWENERFFRRAEAALLDLLNPSDRERAHAHLFAVQRRNLALYGFGIKGFTLSMIEAAVEWSGGNLPGDATARIIAIGQEMLCHPVELRPGAAETLATLSGRRLILITKGDVMDQERKVALSGLAAHFERVEIVQDKTLASYRNTLTRAGVAPSRFVMIGNSVVSDITPVLATGAAAILVPHALTWAHESAPDPDHPRFRRIDSLAGLPALLGVDMSATAQPEPAVE